MLMTTYHQKKTGHGGELCLSIHQGGTQVRETWLRDAFGLATTVWDYRDGELGWEESHGRDAVSRPRQYSSTVTSHTGGGAGRIGGECLEIDRKQFDE